MFDVYYYTVTWVDKEGSTQRLVVSSENLEWFLQKLTDEGTPAIGYVLKLDQSGEAS